MQRRAFLAALAALGLAPAARAARPVQGLVIHDAPRPMPSLEILDEAGNRAPLDGLRGQGVLLNLWASWCMPCVAELPALDRLKPLALAKNVAVVALSLDRGGKITVVNTFARLGIKALEIRTDDKREAAEKLAANALPVTLLLDRQGREIGRYLGAADWEGPVAARMIEALGAGKPVTADMAPPLAKLTSAP